MPLEPGQLPPVRLPITRVSSNPEDQTLLHLMAKAEAFRDTAEKRTCKIFENFNTESFSTIK